MIDDRYLMLKDWLEETKDEPLESMDSFFDARIGGYEAHMSHWAGHYKRIAELIPADTKTLLDIGCGTGLELDEIFKKLPGLAVTGVDLSGEMLKKLRGKHPDKNLTLLQEDYFLCDLGEAKYDIIISFETLHHFTLRKKTELFKNLRRALKPGGLYIECDYIATSPEIETMTFAACKRRRERDGIPEDAFVHFDTPLTFNHEMVALQNGGFTILDAEFLPHDEGTVIIRAN